MITNNLSLIEVFCGLYLVSTVSNEFSKVLFTTLLSPMKKLENQLHGINQILKKIMLKSESQLFKYEFSRLDMIVINNDIVNLQDVYDIVSRKYSKLTAQFYPNSYVYISTIGVIHCILLLVLSAYETENIDSKLNIWLGIYLPGYISYMLLLLLFTDKITNFIQLSLSTAIFLYLGICTVCTFTALFYLEIHYLGTFLCKTFIWISVLFPFIFYIIRLIMIKIILNANYTLVEYYVEKTKIELDSFYFKYSKFIDN